MGMTTELMSREWSRMAGEILAVMATVLLLVACSDYSPVRSELTVGPDHTYVAAVPGSGLPDEVEAPLLQACVNNASAVEKQKWGSDFNYMKFDSDYLTVEKVNRYIGKQYVEARLKGQGAWWGNNADGAGEYRTVTFNCLLNKTGAVYTLVQGE
jgi:hypothetical protein